MLPLVSLVIPVKGGPGAKTRLVGPAAGRAALASAIALDTVEAARASTAIGELVVVGRLPTRLPGVRVVDDPGAGLRAAIESGLAALDADRPTAVLLGDLPALQPDELSRALAAAHEHDRAFVPDAEGTGTTLIVARAGVPHAARFGAASAARHRAEGYVELELPPFSGLRRDIDTREQLEAAASLVLGARTRALVSRSA
ncbi:2-phospho-L-lactate guanylyltransferase [Microcella indica]|uniref:2-phospho-L-lactate guanylyltransferase n=1 Tax=Microcella indica TaxID=2750620 RepID=UPI001C54DD65|nr:2-phospho-L-lactate guanylyltransferase [Microcella indica]